MLHLFRKNLFADPFFRSFRRFGRIFDDVDRLFTTLGPATFHHRADFPLVDVHTGEEGALVSVEVPGIATEDLDVSVLGKTLTIRGSRPAPELGEDERDLRRERFHGEFVRSVELPYAVDPEKVTAEHKHGILEIRLERPEAEKPRQITVNLGA